MSKRDGEDVVGIMPAAGRARRSATLPCSKEIFPLGLRGDAGDARTEPVCEGLLAGFRTAGADRAVVAVRPGKWDILDFLGDGAEYGVPLGYVTVADSPGVPWTVAATLPFASRARVLFGFPDILVRPVDALARLLDHQGRSGAEITLGLLPARRPELVDMVRTDDEGRVRDVVIKPASSELRFTWLLACWAPAFSDFLADYAARPPSGASEREVHMGDVVQAAVAAGRPVDSVTFHQGTYRDVGTPAELAAALREVG